MSDLIEVKDVLTMLQGPRANAAGQTSVAIYEAIVSSRPNLLSAGSLLQAGSVMRTHSNPQLLLPSILNAGLVPAMPDLSHRAAADSGTLPFPEYLARLTSASHSSSSAGWRHPASARHVSESQLAIISSSACTSGTTSGKAANDPEVQQSLMELVMGRRPLGAQVRGSWVEVGGAGHTQGAGHTLVVPLEREIKYL